MILVVENRDPYFMVHEIIPTYHWVVGNVIPNTVDERNPAPVNKDNIPLFTRFLSSQVVQDFFHQQY